MKYILFFLLCSLSAHIQAQTTTKTFVLGSDGVTYFEVTTITNDDETATSTKVKVGTVSDIAADAADKIESVIRNLALNASAVSFTNRLLNEQGTIDTDIKALTGTSPLSLIQGRYSEALLAPGWTIDQGAGFLPLVFTVNAQGVLRYSVNGATTKQAKVYGNVIRLVNYPTNATDTDFYLSENGSRYFSLPNRANVIKKP